MVRRLSMILALLLALAACLSGLAEEGFEGFDVVIIGGEQSPSAAAQGAGIAGDLELTLGKARVEEAWDGKADDTHLYIGVEAHIINWSKGEITIADSLQSTLTWQDGYTFAGAPEFSRAKLGMLEELDGTLVFRVPAIVAFSGPGALTLSVVAAGEALSQELDLTKAAEGIRQERRVPFSVDNAAGAVLEAAAGEPMLFDSYGGVSDEVSKWVVMPISVINWSHERVLLDEDAFEAKIVYDGSYGFVGTLDYSQEGLEPLECAAAELAVRVPTMVTRASSDLVELWLDAEGFELRQPLDLSQAAQKAEAAREARRAQFEVGKIVTFGHYEQDNDISNGQEPIEWIVLAREDDCALLLSKYGLDTKPYNTEQVDITWETCTLRAWLNDDFLNAAFTVDEQAQIVLTNVDNSQSQGNSGWNTSGGSDTQDKVFLLSYNEAGTWFSSDEARKCAPTDYAIAQGAYTSSDNKTAEGEAAGFWWLRSPGDDRLSAANVIYDGSRNIDRVNYVRNVARPAFWINLESGIF